MWKEGARHVPDKPGLWTCHFRINKLKMRRHHYQSYLINRNGVER